MYLFSYCFQVIFYCAYVMLLRSIFQVDMPDRTLFKNSNIQTIRNIVNNYCTDCWSLSDMRFCSSQKIFLLTFSGRNCSVGALKVVFPLNLL